MENMRKFLEPLTDLHALVTDALKAMDQSLIKADKSFSESNHRIVRLPTTSFRERFIAWPTQAVNTAGDKWSVDRARGLEKRYSLPENAMEFETDAAAREFLSAYLVGLRSVMKQRFRAMNAKYRYQIDGNLPTPTFMAHPEEPLYINWAVRDTVDETLVCVIGGSIGDARSE